MTKVTVWNVDYVDTFTSPVNGLEKVVKSCKYTVSMTEDVVENEENKTYSVSNYGYCDFDPPDDQMFIAFENLDKETVLSWVWTKVDKTSIEASLSASIESAKTPATVQMMLPS